MIKEIGIDPVALSRVKNAIGNIKEEDVNRYLAYWNRIVPKSDDEVFRRWLFAYLSVHTTWKTNVDSYLLLRDLRWRKDKNQLSELIIKSGVGLHKVRTEGIHKFDNDFTANPEQFKKQSNESWVASRDRMVDLCFGLGFAKVSFALELCYPEDCEVTCLDVHLIRLYGAKKSIKGAPYRKLESDWVGRCKKKHYSVPIARHLYWDTLQSRPDTRYWSHVFENE